MPSEAATAEPTTGTEEATTGTETAPEETASAPTSDAPVNGKETPAESNTDAPSSDDTKTTLLGESPEGDDTASEPEPYDEFTLPEGFEMDEKLLQDATPFFRELGLDQEGAQKAIDFYSNLRQQEVAAAAEDWQAEQEANLKTIKDDPVFGKSKYEESLADARRAVDQAGGDELREFLNTTHLGNHPVVFKAFANIGRWLSEDTVVSGSPHGQTEKSRAERMFPGIADSK